jgi:hypothetical protein
MTARLLDALDDAKRGIVRLGPIMLVTRRAFQQAERNALKAGYDLGQ